MIKNIIFTQDDFRIVEIHDETYIMADLKGDTYKREVNPDIPEDQLAHEEKEFERLVETEGVYGYELEKWNPWVGIGWTHVDSCWGFVGRYSEKFNHYIVEEMKRQITPWHF